MTRYNACFTRSKPIKCYKYTYSTTRVVKMMEGRQCSPQRAGIRLCNHVVSLVNTRSVFKCAQSNCDWETPSFPFGSPAKGFDEKVDTTLTSAATANSWLAWPSVFWFFTFWLTHKLVSALFPLHRVYFRISALDSDG